MKVHLASFHLNGHALGLHPQTLSTPLYSIINSTLWKYCSTAVIWRVAHYGFIIHRRGKRLKPPCTTWQTVSRILLNSFRLNVYTLEFLPQTWPFRWKRVLVSERLRGFTRATTIKIIFVWFCLQYLVDSKLDQVFHEFLGDLVTEEEFIPASPYPRLTTDLTVAAMR